MIQSGSSVSASTETVASQRSCPASPDSPTSSLVEDRKLAQRLLTDLLIFMLLVIPIPICEFGIEPFRLGFFCDDETIRYPFLQNTVTPVMLGLIVGLLPALIIVVVEILRFHRKSKMGNMIFVFDWKIPAWLIKCTRQMAYYAVGLVITFDATEIGKYTIGRLRPHFIAVCQPQLADGSTCLDGKNQNRYIEDYVCLGDGFSALDVLEARRSFPSGHSSLAFYAMVYIAIYIQRRLTLRGSSLTRPFLQSTAIFLAWFTALTRIIDNWHHWSDVLCGSMIGIVGALITARFISKFNRKNSGNGVLMRHSKDSCNLTSLKISIPRQDTSTTLDEVISTPPPYQLSTANSFNHEQYCTKAPPKCIRT